MHELPSSLHARAAPVRLCYGCAGVTGFCVLSRPSAWTNWVPQSQPMLIHIVFLHDLCGCNCNHVCRNYLEFHNKNLLDKSSKQFKLVRRQQNRQCHLVVASEKRVRAQSFGKICVTRTTARPPHHRFPAQISNFFRVVSAKKTSSTNG
eukprot:4087412-Amphidinium_carterae.1